MAHGLVHAADVRVPHATIRGARMSTRARRGMTLMELVIGLAITGMMAAAGAGTFASIIDHRRTIQHASLSIERAAALREMIHSGLITGSVQIQRGGGPRGVTRSVAAARPGTQAGNNIASVSAAQASGDELNFTTTAVTCEFQNHVLLSLMSCGRDQHRFNG